MTSCRTDDDAATYVRFVCGVDSRAKIGRERASLVKWRDLDAEYLAWRSDPEPVDPLALQSQREVAA
jgi:hypothetical protein